MASASGDLDRDLDMFVLFSSRVGVMGNPGQANHASANAFLDQLAGHRRAMGLPGQAIAWGAWSEIGEAAEQRERIDQQRSALGGRWFTPQQGIRAFDQLVRQDATTSVVMSMDWSVFEEAGRRPSSLPGGLAVRRCGRRSRRLGLVKGPAFPTARGTCSGTRGPACILPAGRRYRQC